MEPQKRHQSTAGRDHAGMVPIGAPVEKGDDGDLNRPPRSQKDSAISTRLPHLYVSEKLHICSLVFAAHNACAAWLPRASLKLFLSGVLDALGCCAWLGLVCCANTLCALRGTHSGIGTGLGASGISVRTSKSFGLCVTAPLFGVWSCRHITFPPLRVVST